MEEMSLIKSEFNKKIIVYCSFWIADDKKNLKLLHYRGYLSVNPFHEWINCIERQSLILLKKLN
jgi:hypothetical protein